MAKVSVTAVRSKATRAPNLMLTQNAAETVHRVACVLKFLADVEPPDVKTDDDDDAEFGRFILLRDLAASLRYAQEMNYGRQQQE